MGKRGTICKIEASCINRKTQRIDYTVYVPFLTSQVPECNNFSHYLGFTKDRFHKGFHAKGLTEVTPK